MTEIFIQLKNSIVIIEATQGADFIVELLRKDGYDARKAGDEFVIVKERISESNNRAS